MNNVSFNKITLLRLTLIHTLITHSDSPLHFSSHTSIHSSWHIQVLYTLIRTYSYFCIHFSSHTQVLQYIPNCTLRFSSTLQLAHSGFVKHFTLHDQVLQYILAHLLGLFPENILWFSNTLQSSAPRLRFYNLFQITCSGFSVHTRVLRFFNTFKLLSLFVGQFLFLWGMCV